MRRGRLIVLASLAAGAWARPAGATAAAEPIGVVAPARSRLADEMRRELAAAQIAWVSMVVNDLGWPGEAADLGPTPYARGVVVASSDARLIVFSRAAASGHAEIRLELRVDPSDRPARRRACLAAVEELRVLGEPAAPQSGWAADETAAPPPAAAADPPAGPREVVGVAPAPPGEPATGRGWIMGAATTLDLDRRLGAQMVHLQFTWLGSIGRHLAVQAQAMWPLVGSELRLGGVDTRIWTFGAALGLQYLFAADRARLRPFVGIATGSQLLLTDTPAGAMDTDRGRSLFVPSFNLRAQSGVRLALTAHARLLCALEATRDWLLQPSRTDYQDSAANTFALHASLGLLFEY